MFQKIYKKIVDEFSGVNAKEIIGGIANFHRIQSSPGFRAAAKYCQNRLIEYNIPSVKIHSYPAQGHNSFWGCFVPKEWSIENASLELIEPRESAKTLSRFFEFPCSIIQRSKATPTEGLIGEVVVLPRDLSDKEIRKFDFKNKFVLTDEPDLDLIRLLVVNEMGALGIIYDLVSEFPPYRTRSNFPSAHRYTSFWYGGKGLEGDALGFVLSAEEGENLRQLIKKIEINNSKEQDKKSEKKKVLVKANISSKFYDGEMEVVEFLIPGKEQNQEIIAVAHLCHPKPGAIDNASGCGTLIEVARTIQSLIQKGILEQPKRSIRFLLMAEYTGSFCYLASNEEKIDKFVAGINLDMVGADQSIGGGRTLVMEKTHDSFPSYVNDVLSTMLNETSKEIKNFQNVGGYAASFKFANDQPFSGGSDHAILGFPDVGIGTPMFIQWPDKYYHTGEDSMEKVSPHMLDIVGRLTATYCFFLANAELPEMIWITKEIGAKSTIRLAEFSKKVMNDLSSNLEEEKDEKIFYEFLKDLKNRYNYQTEIQIKTVQSVKKLVLKKDEEKIIEELIKDIIKTIHQNAESEYLQVKKTIEKLAQALKMDIVKTPELEEDETNEYQKKAEKIIPQKKYRGPITGLQLDDQTLEEKIALNEMNKQFKGMRPIMESAAFWIDGDRTVAEISNLVKYDIGKTNIEYLMKMMEYYEKNGILELREKKS